MHHALKISVASIRGLGPELVPDPDFNAAGQWVTGTGWAVSGGVATATDAANGAVILIPVANRPNVVAGERYQWVIIVDSVTAGGVALNATGWALGPTLSAAGAYGGTAIVTTTSTAIGISIRTIGVTTAVVTRFSVRKIL